MRTIVKPRQGGKTYDLIKLSAEIRCPIIVYEGAAAHKIKERAKSMGLDIPEPLCIKQVMNTRILSSPRVLVDDAERILAIMMQEICGVRCIEAIAVTKRNEKGHEISIFEEDLNEKYGTVPASASDQLDANDKINNTSEDDESHLTTEQIILLSENGITDPLMYRYADIYTSTNIFHSTNKTEVSKYMRFEHKLTKDIIEIKIDVDDLIVKHYLGGKEND